MKILTKLGLLTVVAFTAANASAIPISTTGTINGQAVNAGGTFTAGLGL